MEHEITIKTEPCEPNTEPSPALFDGNIKLELKTEPQIVEFDTDVFTQNQHQFEDNDFVVSSNYMGFDSTPDNEIDESIVNDDIVKEEPEYYDPTVGEFVPSSELTELVASNSAKECNEKSNSVHTSVKNPNQNKPFQCQQCSATFKHNFMLTQHIKIHKQMAKTDSHVRQIKNVSNRQRLSNHDKSKKPFDCSICHKKFNSKPSLDAHETVHTGEKSFQCEQCFRPFRLKHHLDMHRKIHEKKVENNETLLHGVQESLSNQSNSNEAKKVSKIFNANPNNIDESTVVDEIIKEEPEFYDLTVGKIVPPSQMTQSLESNTPSKVQSNLFKCQQCSATFNQNSMLTQHKKIHKQMSAAERFVCSYCLRRFSTRQRLNRHERVHRGEKPFDCSICHKRFNSKSSLEMHQSIHTGQTPFQCYLCKQQFRLKQQLDRHIKIHHTKNVKYLQNYNRVTMDPIPEHLIGLKLFECYLCSGRFQFNQSHLKLHFHVEHIGGTAYECDHCSKKFFLKNSIMEHMHRVHIRTLPFKCNICEKQFRSKCDLQRHLQNHDTNNSQKFQCEFCSMQLSTKKILKIHQKTHTGLKPYECEYCEKKFLKPGCLRRHTMTHTGEKPFGCNICFQKFSRNHLLTEHKRKVHKMF